MHEAAKAPAGSFQVGERVPGTPYRVVGVLGAANAGSVYEVEHVELGKHFALKALPPDAARFDTVGRLKNEWRALARLAHPNIIEVSDAGSTPDGLPFFVMERLDGESLRTRLEREERLRASEAIGIAAGVAAALGAAHRIGVVHRDVKPENIFLTRSGRAKLLDFGLAKLHSAPSKLTAHGVTVGTPRYMAPEQALGERVDHRADFYALGLVLFEMLAGAGPFDDAEDTGAMLLRRVTGKAPSLATRAAGLPADLDTLVSELLARNPADRPPDARSIADALQQIGSRLLAPVTHDSPTREAMYEANTRPTIVPRAGDETQCDAVPAGAQTQRDAVPAGSQTQGEPVAGQQTRPDGVAARSSAPPPPAIDPNATVLAIPTRRAVPPPLPVSVAEMPPPLSVAVAEEPTTIPLPVPAPPPVAAPVASGALSRRTVALRAALIGAGAAVLLLCCFAFGWALLGGAESAGHDAEAAAITPTAAPHSAQRHAAARASAPSKPDRARSAASKPRRPRPAAKRVAARSARRVATGRVTRRVHHTAAAKTMASRAAGSRHHRANRAVPPARVAASTDDTHAAPPLCQPEIPPNPYGALPPSGL